MSELANIFDLIYTRFLLRDFCGKIIPGFIVIFTCIFVIFDQNSSFSDFFNFSFWGWILFIGISWLSGLIIQSLGNWSHIIYYELPRNNKRVSNYHNPNIVRRAFHRVFQISQQDEEESITLLHTDLNKIRFFQMASTDEKQQRERYVVLKEATGNCLVATLISLVVLVVGFITNSVSIIFFPGICLPLSEWWQKTLICILLVVIISLFYYMYRRNKSNQYNYQTRVIRYHHNGDSLV